MKINSAVVMNVSYGCAEIYKMDCSYLIFPFQYSLNCERITYKKKGNQCSIKKRSNFNKSSHDIMKTAPMTSPEKQALQL